MISLFLVTVMVIGSSCGQNSDCLMLVNELGQCSPRGGDEMSDMMSLRPIVFVEKQCQRFGAVVACFKLLLKTYPEHDRCPGITDSKRMLPLVEYACGYPKEMAEVIGCVRDSYLNNPEAQGALSSCAKDVTDPCSVAADPHYETVKQCILEDVAERCGRATAQVAENTFGDLAKAYLRETCIMRNSMIA